MNSKEAAVLNAARIEIKHLWVAACEADGIPGDSKFAIFSDANAAAVTHNAAMLEFMELRNKIIRNANRRERHATLKSLGLKRVKGALGGVYFE